MSARRRAHTNATMTIAGGRRRRLHIRLGELERERRRRVAYGNRAAIRAAPGAGVRALVSAAFGRDKRQGFVGLTRGGGGKLAAHKERRRRRQLPNEAAVAARATSAASGARDKTTRARPEAPLAAR